MHDNVRERIKEIIKETGIKQVHLAKKLGITPQHLNNILERNQQKGEYIPKISKILGIDVAKPTENLTKSISVFSEKELTSIANNKILFEDVMQTAMQCWPDFKYKDGYHFGYKIKETVHASLLKNDILICSSSIPLNLEKKIGIAFIQEKSLIFVGKVSYNSKKLIIYNDKDFYLFSSGDLLLGVAVYLERNIEEFI